MYDRSILTSCSAALGTGTTVLVTLVCGVAFWTAIVLPILYLTLLLTGSARIVVPTGLVKLVGLNVVALVIGQFYDGGRLRAIVDDR